MGSIGGFALAQVLYADWLMLIDFRPRAKPDVRFVRHSDQAVSAGRNVYSLFANMPAYFALRTRNDAP